MLFVVFQSCIKYYSCFFSAYPSNQTNKSLFSKSFVLRFKSRNLAQLFFFSSSPYFLSCVSVHSRRKKNLQEFLSLYTSLCCLEFETETKEPVDSDCVCGKYCARKNKSLNQNFSSSHQTKQGKHT